MMRDESVSVQNKGTKVAKRTFFLLGAVLVTTSLLGTTLAKYISDIGEAKDSARVAKWGLKGSNQTIDLFKTAYEETVKGSNNEKVIAPGTEGSVVLTPEISDEELKNVEVAFKVSYSYGDYASSSVFANYLGNWDSSEGFNWWPLRFKVSAYDPEEKSYTNTLYDGINVKKTDSGDKQFDELNNAIANFQNGEVIYPTDSVVSKKEKLASSGLQIEWAWPFERPESGAAEAANRWDSVIGKRASELESDDPNMPKFSLSMKYTATQID